MHSPEPPVKAQAAIQLSSMVMPALAVLAREITSTTNRPQDRIRAAEAILDRAGMPRQVGIDTETAAEVLLAKLRRVRDRTIDALPTAPVDTEGDNG